MSRIKENIEAWYRIVQADTKPQAEDPEIQAGREAENMLRGIVGEHYQFKGAHCFSAKRVYNPVVGHKNEIDLIIITEKKLYVLECKNWGGRLKKEGDKWVQYKRQPGGTYRTIEHEDAIAKTDRVLESLIGSLRSNGIIIPRQECSRKVILMNKNLAIDSEEIYKHPDVIPPDRLYDYLGGQETQLKRYQQWFSFVITTLLDEESSAKIIDGLFKRLGGKNHSDLINIISKLPTWDKVKLYGGVKIISGDIRESDLSIFKFPLDISPDKIKKICVNITRAKGTALAKAVLCIGWPVSLDLIDSNGNSIKTVEGNPNGLLRIQKAGQPDCIDIPLFEIETILYGRSTYKQR